jgi:hypothetical protein
MLISTPGIFFVFYLFGATAGFYGLDWSVAMLLLIGVFLVHHVLPGASCLAFCSMIEHAAACYPAPVAAAGLATAGALWHYMGRVRLVPSSYYEDDEADEPVRSPGSRFGQFLLGEATRRSHLDRWRYACGALYRAPVLRNARLSFLGSLIILALIAYVPWARFVLFILACVDPVRDVNLPVRSTFFPVAGRRERYFATMALVAALWVYSLLVGGAIILATNLLVCVVPDLAVASLKLRPSFVEIEYLCVPLAGTPLVILGRALYHESRAGFVVLILVGVCLFFTIPIVAAVLSTRLVFGVAALAWLLCAVTFRRMALCRDLVWRKQ